MTVYVDDMMASFGRMKMCHIIADTEVELHAMADRIGVARRWYQGDHYDIASSKRALAVAAGVVEITWRQCSAMCALRRRDPNVKLVGPAEAIEMRQVQDEKRTNTRDLLAPATDGEDEKAGDVGLSGTSVD